jgi:hypothetical protein
LDGQQRTISFCQYVGGQFSVPVNGNPMAFHNLTQTLQDQILNYRLMVYWCEGTDQERLDWFRIINIAGAKLTDQELRNAVYTGPWLSHAKSIFSKTNCAAHMLAHNYVNGTPIRQEILETAIEWISDGKVEEYMSAHQHDQNANELWEFFQAVIHWVPLTFTTYRNEMKGLPWGPMYNQFHGTLYDTAKLEGEIRTLMMDDDVTQKRGVYRYVLTSDERFLAIRAFTPKQRREAYERQKGICPKCSKHFEYEQMEADHITPWSKGGRTDADNCQMLCLEDNRRKGAV